MIDRDQTLVLFTASYPYGISETFLETEIIYLSKSFSKIYIIPYNIGESLRSLPSNVEVVENIDDSNYNRSKIVRLYGWQIGKILSIELLKGRVFHREIHYTISLLLRLFERARLLEKWILSSDNRDDIVFYSYWFTEWSTILSILKSRDIIKIFFSKAHRFDLYEYRSKYGFIPFREFQLKHIDRLILISEDGLNYISQKTALNAILLSSPDRKDPCLFRLLKHCTGTIFRERLRAWSVPAEKPEKMRGAY